MGFVGRGRAGRACGRDAESRRRLTPAAGILSSLSSGSSAVAEITLRHPYPPGPPARAARRRGGSASTPAARPSTGASTSATRGRSSSSRCSSASSARGLRGHAGRQRHRRQRQDLRGGARVRLERRAGRGDDRRVHRRHRPARARPPRPRAARERVDRRDHRVDRGADRRAATPMPPTATSTSACAAIRATASCRSATSTRWTRARASRAPQRKHDPLDFALWKAQKPGEDTPGTRPGGAAAPAGTSSARRWRRRCSAPTSRSTAAGSDLIFPHHENEAAQTRCARGARARAPWMHNGMLAARRREDVEVGRQHLAAARGARRVRPRRADHLLRAGHYRQPLAFGEERLAAAAAGVARIREAARRLVAGRVAGRSAPLRDRSSTRSPTTSTRRGAGGDVGVDPRGNRRGAGVGDGDLREMLGVLGLENLLERLRARPPQVVALARERQAARAARRLRARRRAARAVRGARLVGARHAAGGFELTPLA